MEKQENESNKEFYAPVKMVKSSTLTTEVNFLSYNNSVVIVDHPELGPTVVNNCSDGYGLIPTYQIFPIIEKKLEEKFSIKRNYEVRDVAKFYANYTITDLQVNVGKEKLEPFVRFQTSYNSKIQFSAFFGFYIKRLNLYIYGGERYPVSLSHTEGNIEKIIEGTFKGVDNLIKEMEKLPAFSILSQNVITREHLSSFIEKTIETTKFYQIPKDIEETILSEMKILKEKEINKWMLYLAMMSQLAHNPKIKMQPENQVALDIKVCKELVRTSQHNMQDMNPEKYKLTNNQITKL